MVKEHKELLDQKEDIVFEKSLIRLAIPESKSEADLDRSHLAELDPPVRKELKDIPRTLWNSNGEETLNVECVREYVRVTMELQEAHTAKALPMDALNKGTEVVTETARKIFEQR